MVERWRLLLISFELSKGNKYKCYFYGIVSISIIGGEECICNDEGFLVYLEKEILSFFNNLRIFVY